MSLVMKFGGTSVGSADAMRSAADLILKTREKWGEVVVIASGMGSKPVKVTDLLLNGATGSFSGESSAKDSADHLRKIHFSAIKALLTTEQDTVTADVDAIIQRFESLCTAVDILGELSPRALDAIGGMGEQMSVRILAAYLREIGHEAVAIDATELIRTDSNFQNAGVDFGETNSQTSEKVLPLLEKGVIPIITGFIGANADGVTTTLGRGGSDYSAAIIGQAVSAQEVWIWTDVDGVMSADPRLVSDAVSIPELTHREISELAYYGAKVLHPKTIRPVVEKGIPLRIKNTFNPEHDGTVIVQERAHTAGSIKAVTAIKKLAFVTLEGKGMVGVPGIAARTFGAVAAHDVSVLLITQASSEQSICFATSGDSAATIQTALNTEFKKEIANRDIDEVSFIAPCAIITVVGAGMAGAPGVAGRIFNQLGTNNVNLIAIAQGSSECAISCVVAEKDADQAVQLIHDLIIS